MSLSLCLFISVSMSLHEGKLERVIECRCELVACDDICGDKQDTAHPFVSYVSPQTRELSTRHAAHKAHDRIHYTTTTPTTTTTIIIIIIIIIGGRFLAATWPLCARCCSTARRRLAEGKSGPLLAVKRRSCEICNGACVRGSHEARDEVCGEWVDAKENLLCRCILGDSEGAAFAEGRHDGRRDGTVLPHDILQRREGGEELESVRVEHHLAQLLPLLVRHAGGDAEQHKQAHDGACIKLAADELLQHLQGSWEGEGREAVVAAVANSDWGRKGEGKRRGKKERGGNERNEKKKGKKKGSGQRSNAICAFSCMFVRACVCVRVSWKMGRVACYHSRNEQECKTATV